MIIILSTLVIAGKLLNLFRNILIIIEHDYC